MRKQTLKMVLRIILCLVLLLPSIHVFAQETQNPTQLAPQADNEAEPFTNEKTAEQDESDFADSKRLVQVNIEITKQWQQADGSALADFETSELTFRLFADAQPIQDIVITSAPNHSEWSKVIENLPYLNDQGEVIDYQIQEIGEAEGKITLAGKTYSVTVERRIDQANMDTTGVEIEFIVTNQVLAESSSTAVDEALVEISAVTARGGSYAKDVTFVGQWINESSQLVNTVKSFTAGSDKLGEPRANSGLLRGLAKTFLGWSDKPPVGNGQLAEGARLFSPHDTIETVFADGIMDDAKLYGVYFSLNRPDKPFSNWDFFSMFSAVGSLPIDNNKLIINSNISPENTLPNTVFKEVNEAGAIIDFYAKKDDVNSINEVVLEAEFEMDSTVAMLAYKNPRGGNAVKPILSYDYDTHYQDNDFSTAVGRVGYTYVDLNVNLDERLNVPEVLYLQFEGFSWRPLYVLSQNREILEIINPMTGESLGNDVNSFSSLVSNTDPKIPFAVKLNGNKNITIRVVLRNGDAEKIQESSITPNPDGTIAERILENMRLKAFSATELRNIMPDKSEQEINALTLKINDSVATQLADSQGQDTLKIIGSISGNVVANAGSVNLPIIGSYALRHEQEIAKSNANTIALGFKQPMVTLKWSTVWDDENDKYGYRPQNNEHTIIVKKTVDGVTTEYWRNDQNTTSLEVPEFENGKPITWSLDELDIPYYTKNIASATEPNSFVVTNAINPPTTQYTVEKEWEDMNNVERLRPAMTQVQLYENGVEVGSPVTLLANKSYTWTNLIKYKTDGVYTVREIDVPSEYTAAYDYSETKTVITNTLKPIYVSVTGSKIWEDANNQDGVRPTEITVILKADGVVKEEKVVTATDNWSYAFSNLPKYRDQGVLIVYTIEEKPVDDYQTGYNPNNYDIVNLHTPEVIEISGQKHWEDANNQDGVRPTEITVILKADDVVKEEKVVTATDNWSYTFSNLPKYRDQGVAIVYTVEEKPVTNYEGEVNGYDLVNKHTPEVIEISGQKHWEDNNNQDGVRPTEIIVILKANGVVKEEKVVTATDNWSYTFSNLPKYRDQGVAIVYTVEEKPITNYEVEVNGYDLVNKHTPQVIEISGQKHWEDADNQDGVRPAQITVILKADGVVKEEKVVTATDNWMYTFSNLPKYRDQGVLVVYTVEEKPVANYEVEVNGFDLVNKHTPEVIEISGQKHWEDNNNQDGLRPTEITVILKADDVVKEEKVVTATDNWSYTFSNLPKYRDQGVAIVYTVEEKPVTNYEGEVNGYDLVNKHTPEVIEISGQKHWEDANNQDGVRPTEITVILKADGVVKEEKVVTATDNWMYTFSNLPKYRDQGVLIVYTIEEKAVDGYTSVIKTGQFDITNTHKPEMVEIGVEKVWQDEQNQDGSRPQTITVVLLANGEKVAGKTIELSASVNWKGVFENLPKYKAGQVIKYSVEEVNVPKGYKAVVTENGTYQFIITNSHTPELPNTGMSHGAEVGLIALGCLLVGVVLIRKKKSN